MKTRPMYIHRGRRCQPRRAQVAVAAANTAIDARWLLVLLAFALLLCLPARARAIAPDSPRMTPVVGPFMPWPRRL